MDGLRRTIVEYKVPASYVSIPLFAASKNRKLLSIENSGTKNFNSTKKNFSGHKNDDEDEKVGASRDIGTVYSNYKRRKNKNDYDNKIVNLDNILNDKILIKNKYKYKNKYKKRKLKSRKQNQVREGRTWNVQSMLICNGRNKNASFSFISTPTASTPLTALPCVDILSEIKAQGNLFIFFKF